MSTSAPLVPVPGERGLASSDRKRLTRRVLAGWDEFVTVAEATDLDAPSRLPGWSGRDVLVHLGAWDDARALDGILASARAGGTGDHIDVDQHNAWVIGRHRGATRAEVLESLHAARSTTADFLASAEADELGLLPTHSVLGALPVLTTLTAITYELAVHSVDLGPCGAPAPSSELVQAGLAALMDVTGALAARHGLEVTVAAGTPTGGWAFSAYDGDWTTVALDPGADVSGWPSIEGSALTLLDASAGRVAVPPLLVRRELRTHHVPGLLALAPIVDEVPNLPGGPVLRAAVRYLGGVGKVMRRIPGFGR